jgi:hypothetical protein
VTDLFANFIFTNKKPAHGRRSFALSEPMALDRPIAAAV